MLENYGFLLKLCFLGGKLEILLFKGDKKEGGGLHSFFPPTHLKFPPAVHTIF